MRGNEDARQIKTIQKFGEVIVGDVRDLAADARCCDGIDTVIHLAANPSPFADWDSVLNLNIVGTYNVFLAAKAAKCRR